MSPRRLSSTLAVTVLLIGTAALAASKASGEEADASVQAGMAAGEALVRLRTLVGTGEAAASAPQGAARAGARRAEQLRARHSFETIGPLFRKRLGTGPPAVRQRSGHLSPRGEAAAAALSEVFRVRFDPARDPLRVAADLRREPGVVWAEPNYLYRIDLPVREMPPVAALGGGRAASPSRTAGGAAGLNDPYLSSSGSWGQDFPDLWGLFQIAAPDAWEQARGEGVVVAVIDTGVAVTHADLAANVWQNPGEIADNGVDDDGNGFVDDVHGWDFTRCARRDGGGGCVQAKEPGPDIRDPVGHGTHVAGSIAAVGNNGIGISGVAPAAQVMAVKGLDPRGGDAADLSEAVVYAGEHGAQVINASWSGVSSEALRVALDYVIEALDVTVIASAGNGAEPLERGFYPAALPNVIAVGATRSTGELAAFSNFGGVLDLVAPGGGDAEPPLFAEASILSLLATGSELGQVCHEEEVCDEQDECERVEVCQPAPWVVGTHYVRNAGTSMAAAYVSGVAALVRGLHPDWTHQEVRQTLLAGAEDLGTPGWDAYYGYGRVDAARAVQLGRLPVAQILVPENRAKIWERDLPFTVRGDALVPGGTLREWRLTIRAETETVQHEIGRGTTAMRDGTLGMVGAQDGPALVPGQRYVLDLSVENTDGGRASDSKVVLIPAPLFAAVPLPYPAQRETARFGLQDPAMSDDGTRILFRRSTHIFLYEDGLRELARGDLVGFSRDGLSFVYTPEMSGYIQYVQSLDTGERQQLSTDLLDPLQTSFSVDASRAAFLSQMQQDPQDYYGDESLKLFLYDLPDGPMWPAVTGIAADGRENHDVALSRTGQVVAFWSDRDLDPTTTTGGSAQVFLYDDRSESVRQLTGRSDADEYCIAPTISADGGKVACLARGRGIYVVDTDSGDVNLVTPSDGRPGPILSTDGKHVAFTANVDLDPTVGNEDLNSEVFVLELESGTVAQVTDTRGGNRPSEQAAMDGRGDVFLITPFNALNGLGIFPGSTRFVRRQRAANAPPRLDLAPLMRVLIGATTGIALRASDPDGGKITFHVQRVPPLPDTFYDLAESLLIDHGDGTGEIVLTPQPEEQGVYALRIAAFDEEGGVDVRDVTLTIFACAGDCDASSTVTIAELIRAVAIGLGTRPLDQCRGADTDGDGSVTISELTSAVNAALSGCSAPP